ncbi:hypothetical protein DXU84_00990 [Rahnella sp. RcJ3]|nr:hypothetical protein [Rahnella sp. RcJ3]
MLISWKRPPPNTGKNAGSQATKKALIHINAFFIHDLLAVRIVAKCNVMVFLNKRFYNDVLH